MLGGAGLQCRDSTTYSHFSSLQHVGGYSINILQSILILTDYSTLGGIQHKTSTTNSNFNSLQHIGDNTT